MGFKFSMVAASTQILKIYNNKFDNYCLLSILIFKGFKVTNKSFNCVCNKFRSIVIKRLNYRNNQVQCLPLIASHLVRKTNKFLSLLSSPWRMFSSIKNSTYASMGHDSAFLNFPRVFQWSHFKSTFGIRKKECNVDKSEIENPLLTSLQIDENVGDFLFVFSRKENSHFEFVMRDESWALIFHHTINIFVRHHWVITPWLYLHAIFHTLTFIILFRWLCMRE